MFTISGGTESLESIGERYMHYSNEYITFQGTLVDKALGVAATYVPIFESASSLLAEIDVLCAFAHTAVNAPIGKDTISLSFLLSNFINKIGKHKKKENTTTTLFFLLSKLTPLFLL